MARRNSIPYKEIVMMVIGPLGSYKAARVQRLDMPVNMPSTDIDELGNRLHVGTVTDVPEVSTTFQAMDTSIKIFAAMTGTDADSYPAAGVDISELTEVDIAAYIKSATLEDYVKSVLLRKCLVTDFSYSYSIDGESTEEYTASGFDKTWFRYDIVVDTFEAAESSPASLTEIALELKSGAFTKTVMMDGVYLTWVSGAPATGEYTDDATTITFADTVSTKLVVVYHANPSGTNWSDVSDDSIPEAIRGKDVPVQIGLNSISRVQSVTIRGTFPNTMVKEMGTTNVVGITVQVPQVTGAINVLDTDLELVALLTQGDPDSSDNEFKVSEYTASGVSLMVNLYPPTSDSETRTTTDCLKSVYVPAITITSEGHTTNVGGDSTQTFDWKSTTGACIVFSGYPEEAYIA